MSMLIPPNSDIEQNEQNETDRSNYGRTSDYDRFDEDARFRFIFPIYRRSKKDQTIGVSAFLFANSPVAFALDELSIAIGNIHIKPKIRLANTKKKSRSHLFIISFNVALENTRDLLIHSPVLAVIHDDDNKEHSRPIMYSLVHFTYVAAHGPYLRDDTAGTVAYFRQKVGGIVTLTTRHQNVSDAKREQLKLVLAFALSRLIPFKRPVILYEKNAARYEESGRAVYEALIDKHYKHAYFVIAKNVAAKLQIDERYKQNFLYKNSFKHYLYFFRSRTYIGSEATSHALELRCQNPFAQWQMKHKRNTEIFLQHGVMYMVSLDSPERSSFIRRTFRGKVRIVVSSKKEAQHFIDLAGFSKDELLFTGLAKFDSSYQNPNADKILIMPTYRIWEFNAMRSDPKSTEYSRMIKNIEAAIPNKLRDKVITQYHPLFQPSSYNGVVSEENGAPNNKCTDNVRPNLDEILRDVKLLITDYSSIAYDAFYRGANVIFYWEDLNACMQHYGEPTHLMLDEQSAFGDVCRSQDELAACLDENYRQPQTSENQARYRKIVEFHDGQNTERIVSALENEGII